MEAWVRWAAMVWVSGAFLAGCAAQQEQPTLSSSMDQPSHALTYPEHVAAALARMGEDEELARKHLVEFSAYPERLRAPDWKRVEEAVLLADSEGRGQAFGSATTDVQTVSRFLEESERQLRRKIVGSVNHATKGKGCSEDVGTAAFHSTKRSLARQLEQLSREENAAQHLLTDHRSELGRQNLPALRKQVEAISFVSFTAHVGLDRHWRELQRLSDESSSAEATLQRAIEDLVASLEDPELGKAAEKEAQKRLAAAVTSQEMLKEQTRALEMATDTARGRIDALRADYDQALNDLVGAIQQQAAVADAAE